MIEVPIWAEEYDNWNESYTGGNQQHLHNTEERISNRVLEITEAEQQMEKKNF